MMLSKIKHPYLLLISSAYVIILLYAYILKIIHFMNFIIILFTIGTIL